MTVNFFTLLGQKSKVSFVENWMYINKKICDKNAELDVRCHKPQSNVNRFTWPNLKLIFINIKEIVKDPIKD